MVNFAKNELHIEIKTECIESEAKAEKICNNLTVKSKMLTLANSLGTDFKYFYIFVKVGERLYYFSSFFPSKIK